MARILIVEDNPDNMKLFRALLTLKGHEVTALQSGDGLQEALDQHRPDLVLMDIQLPGINGIEAFRQIRADPKTARIPVVALTASVTPTDRSQITAAGFDAFVGKPINLKEFLDTVKRLVAGPK
jgi:two-component system cell cycle response regulator DivK